MVADESAGAQQKVAPIIAADCRRIVGNACMAGCVADYDSIGTARKGLASA
jgi:hypothetical protein